jgi:hypothetical protein
MGDPVPFNPDIPAPLVLFPDTTPPARVLLTTNVADLCRVAKIQMRVTGGPKREVAV